MISFASLEFMFSVFTGLFDCILCISRKTQKHDIADWQYCVLCHGRTCFYPVTYFF